jgi:hypothetical protein
MAAIGMAAPHDNYLTMVFLSGKSLTPEEKEGKASPLKG